MSRMAAPARRRVAHLSAALLACAALFAPGADAAGTQEAGRGPLHVPSPDWRDQVVYFVMIDRFDDGDPGNNDQGTGEYDPADSARYSGGDLAGIERRLDYIRGLGASAIWITPPVAHQWWNAATRYGGYHGYWGEDFMAVDPHFGTLEDYRRLSRAIHGAGMYLVQDIVVNHVANFFAYEGEWDPDDPAHKFVLIPDAHGRTAPTQPPFNRNDARDPAQRADGIYHWTPDIADFADRTQELEFQLAGLDDLNTAHPEVRRALRRSYGHWIGQVGVDAFRVDTAFHVPAEFFDDFLHADDADAPGVLRVAGATGRAGFHVFGEGFGIDRPFEDAQARRHERYMRDADGKRLLPGMINFPLYGGLGDVFARGEPTAVLAHRIGSMVELHPDIHLMPSFIDNHDVDRFLAGADEAALKQALLALMTLPGIPVVYYGTEQGFTQRRAAMFAAGHGSGGVDHFDVDAPLYRYLADVIALRRAHPLFSRGLPTVLRDSGAGPGVLAWRTDHGDEAALVVFNTADHPVQLDGLESGAAAGSVLRGAYAIDGRAGDLVVDEGGRVALALPPRSGQVWMLPPGSARVAGDASEGRPLQVEHAWPLLAEVADPAGDDHGPEGRYLYPEQGGWREHRQADIRNVRVYASGGSLRVELRMAEVTTPWNPPNGFDHVAFSLFLELPGRDGGARVMPLQNARLPGDMRWPYRLRAHGWSNALFAHEGASATHEGRAVVPAAGIEVDAEADTVSFILPASALGDPRTLSGARLYVATWDYDDGFRRLAPGGQPGIFGGGDGARDPLVMDDTGIIVLP